MLLSSHGSIKSNQPSPLWISFTTRKGFLLFIAFRFHYHQCQLSYCHYIHCHIVILPFYMHCHTVMLPFYSLTMSMSNHIVITWLILLSNFLTCLYLPQSQPPFCPKVTLQNFWVSHVSSTKLKGDIIRGRGLFMEYQFGMTRNGLSNK